MHVISDVLLKTRTETLRTLQFVKIQEANAYGSKLPRLLLVNLNSSLSRRRKYSRSTILPKLRFEMD